MKNEFIDLEQNLLGRVRAGKNNAILLMVQDKPRVCLNNAQFEVIEFSIFLEQKSGEIISLKGGSERNQMASEEVHYLFVDDKGVEGSQVRFILYRGDTVVTSNIDTITGHVYIAVKNENSSKPHVISFVIANDGSNTCSSLISDGDSSIFQYCRFTSMLIKEV